MESIDLRSPSNCLIPDSMGFSRSRSLGSSGLNRTKSFKANLCALASNDGLGHAVDETIHTEQSSINGQINEDDETSCWGFFAESSSTRDRYGGGKYERSQRRRKLISPYFLPIQNASSKKIPSKPMKLPMSNTVETSFRSLH